MLAVSQEVTSSLYVLGANIKDGAFSLVRSSLLQICAHTNERTSYLSLTQWKENVIFHRLLNSNKVNTV